jgi:hypothetical protein
MAEQNIPSWAEMDKAIAMVVTGVAMQHVLLILPILLILPSTHDMQSVRNSWGTWLEVQAHLSSIACAGLVIGGMIVLHRDMPGSSQQLIYGSCLAAVGGAVLNLAFAWELRNDILISCWLY